MGLTIDLAIAKTNKHASRDSGDAAEVIERPGGGFSVVLADGQGSGRSARTLGHFVCARAVSLLNEGVRDGATARGVNDALLALRHGQVSATLDILSVDLRDGTLLATRFAETPLLVDADGAPAIVPCASGPAGRYALARPASWRWPLAVGLRVVACSDGVFAAGQLPGGEPVDVPACIAGFERGAAARAVADGLLAAALAADRERPADDQTVVVVQIGDHQPAPNLIRRVSVEVPLP